MTKAVHHRTSEILQRVIENGANGQPITLGKFTELLGDRAFALVILIFSLPNSLPIPGIPGFSTLTGLPIVFIAMQMVLGRSTIWLPARFANRQFSQASLAKLLNKAMPAVIWLEKYLMPRMHWVLSPLGERFIGLMFVVLALIICLPIPGGNFLPGLAMSLIALGMLEKDGLFVACALVFSMMSITLMYKVVVFFVKSVVNWVMEWF